MGKIGDNLPDQYVLEQRQAIGKQLKILREDKGLSMAQLGIQIGVDKATVSKIESGKWNFGIDTLTIFANYLDFDITFINKK